MDKVTCRTPNPDKPGVTNQPAWKFQLMRPAILAVLSDGPMTTAQLSEAVKAKIAQDDLDRLGSFGWHLTTIRPELEVRGEIERVAGAKPLTLRRAS